LLASGFEQHPYSGFVRTTSVFGRGHEVEHAQGGAGYWLNRELMALLLKIDVAMEGAEDINIARRLKERGVIPFHDPRYRPDMRTVPMPGNEQISCHDCSIEDFYEIHSKFEFHPSAARPKGLSPELSVSGMERV